MAVGALFSPISTPPSLVMVYFGSNDSMGPHSSGLGPHAPLPKFIENMRKIAIHLKSLSDKTRMIFLSCPPVNEAKLGENKSFLFLTFFLNSSYFSELVRTNELCRIYSEACVELCQEMDVKAVDLWTAIQKRDDWLNACFYGWSSLVEEILKVLKQAEWEPSLHWKSMPTGKTLEKQPLIHQNGLFIEKFNGTRLIYEQCTMAFHKGGFSMRPPDAIDVREAHRSEGNSLVARGATMLRIVGIVGLCTRTYIKFGGRKCHDPIVIQWEGF
ncbi:hypothetical protein Pfo_027539 [Paulownia fortunei]|nr:hypothetical protein Pfo_027539 [Paulownia fortunei]